MTDILRQIEQLRQEIRRHDRLYYTEATPEISDHAYDQLVHQLRGLEAEYPEFSTPNSPTNRIGDPHKEGFAKVRHQVPMLSIDNTYTESELRNFLETRVLEPLNHQAIEWVVELKIDGVAVSLIYEDGYFVQAITRGDGQVGDDITSNMRTVRGIPLVLQSNPQIPMPSRLEIRGEVYMTHDDLEFFLLSQSQEKNFTEKQLVQRQKSLFVQQDDLPTRYEKAVEPIIVNCRNVTAGAIHQKDPKECARRHLRFMAHSVGNIQTIPAATHWDFLKVVRSFGLPTSPKAALFQDADSAIAYCHSLMENIHELPFEIDGFVLKVNRFDLREQIGSTAKSPKWIVAYKFEKYETEAKLHDIKCQVGKSGTVTPVAELVDPQYDGVENRRDYVVIAGTKVQRASLHNAEEIARKDFRIGDRVIVAKAGKIIPQVVRAETHLRDPDHMPQVYIFPDICPMCGSPLVKDPNTVYIRCISPECPAQLKERIVHFASRKAMNIQGLNDKWVEKFIYARFLKSIGDLYRLEENDILPIMQPKGYQKTLQKKGMLFNTGETNSAKKLIEAIAESRSTHDLGHLLYALAIPEIGEKVARTLANAFGSIDSLMVADVQMISSLPDIGVAIANSIFQWLHSEKGRKTIEDLRVCGVQMNTIRQLNVIGPLSGKTFVVTGTLEKSTREEVEERIESLGGKVSKSVSSKTSYVLAGTDAGSKLDKAKTLHLPILTETEFENLIANLPIRPILSE
ncbi:MAG: NAD-dependent DNA ligase LigA [Thermoguttaceae bacterium]|nr:NAD-dependent DNA ligase LigA [Thermoguttaceae bacterium]